MELERAITKELNKVCYTYTGTAELKQSTAIFSKNQSDQNHQKIT